MWYLPLNLLSNILCRLPVEDLLRFRCLSKLHCSVIDSPDFIKLHLNHSIKTGTNRTLMAWDPFRLILTQRRIEHVGSIYDLDSFDQEEPTRKVLPPPLHELLDVFKINGRRCPDVDSVDVFGYCNGMVALYCRSHGVVLWNPSTRKHYKARKFWDASFCYDTFLDGFGYDIVGEDYKVVRIIIRKKGFSVSVYRLKSNSFRKLQVQDESLDLSEYSGVELHQSGVLAGNSLHWMLRRGYIEPYAIFAFNLGGEKLDKVSLPNEVISNLFYRTATLGALGGCLSICCACVDLNIYKYGYDIWIMREHGIESSWTKLYYIPETKFYDWDKQYLYLESKLYEQMEVLCYSESGKKILLLVNRTFICWYDVEKEKLHDLLVSYAPPGRLRARTSVGGLVALPVSRNVN